MEGNAEPVDPYYSSDEVIVEDEENVDYGRRFREFNDHNRGWGLQTQLNFRDDCNAVLRLIRTPHRLELEPIRNRHRFMVVLKQRQPGHGGGNGAEGVAQRGARVQNMEAQRAARAQARRAQNMEDQNAAATARMSALAAKRTEAAAQRAARAQARRAQNMEDQNAAATARMAALAAQKTKRAERATQREQRATNEEARRAELSLKAGADEQDRMNVVDNTSYYDGTPAVEVGSSVGNFDDNRSPVVWDGEPQNPVVRDGEQPPQRTEAAAKRAARPQARRAQNMEDQNAAATALATQITEAAAQRAVRARDQNTAATARMAALAAQKTKRAERATQRAQRATNEEARRAELSLKVGADEQDRRNVVDNTSGYDAIPAAELGSSVRNFDDSGSPVIRDGEQTPQRTEAAAQRAARAQNAAATAQTAAGRAERAARREGRPSIENVGEGVFGADEEINEMRKLILGDKGFAILTLGFFLWKIFVKEIPLEGEAERFSVQENLEKVQADAAQVLGLESIQSSESSLVDFFMDHVSPNFEKYKVAVKNGSLHLTTVKAEERLDNNSVELMKAAKSIDRLRELKARLKKTSVGEFDTTEQNEYRRRMIQVMRKPFNREEYDGLQQAYRRDGSHAKNYPTLASKLEEFQLDMKKCLAMLRGLGFYLQNIFEAGAFKPWEDRQCLAVELDD